MLGYYTRGENDVTLVLKINGKRILNYFKKDGFLRLTFFNKGIICKDTKKYDILYGERHYPYKTIALGKWFIRTNK